MIETEEQSSRAMLVVCSTDSVNNKSSEKLMEELRSLAETLGISICSEESVKLKSINPRYFIGSGKAEELFIKAGEMDADCIIFSNSLSPSQQRNLEKLGNIEILDKQELIIDIFSERALTKEAALQVELARMEYMLPRLVGAWTHLSRQRGGTKGTRGEGEKQIEFDKRYILGRISSIKKSLKTVRKNRDVQRKKRRNSEVLWGSVVGYTNSGKSSLLNLLSNSGVLVENKLFATLDPTTRKIRFEDNTEIYLTDTVGFIRDLPHSLIEAFKSTLEETLLSDFLIHVVDISSEEWRIKYNTTLEVLAELGVDDKKIITVFNKTDLVDNPGAVILSEKKFSDAVFISVKKKKGISDLKNRIREVSSLLKGYTEICLPVTENELIREIHMNYSIASENYNADNVIFRIKKDREISRDLEKYIF